MKPQHLELLTDLVNLPTAPYHERYVATFIRHWMVKLNAGPALRLDIDPAGNIYLKYCRGVASGRTLIFEAHCDHPGFVIEKPWRKGSVSAVFRGGVRRLCFAGARVRFWLDAPNRHNSLSRVPQGKWVKANIASVSAPDKSGQMQVSLAGLRSPLPAGTIGMWDLPDAVIRRDVLYARACDDLAGVAAALCLLEVLVERKSKANIIVLITRAEEIGFAGSLAALHNRWLPADACIIGLETSSTRPESPQGAGPVVRVGDKTSIFSDRLTRFIGASAADLAATMPGFHWQRRLMDGGTCETTAFQAFGFDAAGICLALGNYHNMLSPGVRMPKSLKAGPQISSEYIHLQDFANLVKLLVELAKAFPRYDPQTNNLKDRLLNIHLGSQTKLLFSTRDTSTI